MTKAIFFDIDGTLLSYRTHQILEGTVEAINKLHKNGILTFISSGRPRMLIPEFPVDFDGYITVNGGYCFVKDKVLLRNTIIPDDCKNWLTLVEQNKMTTMCFTENEMYINQIDEAVLGLHEQLGFNMPQLRQLSEMQEKDVFQFIAMQPVEKDQETLSVMPHCRLPRWHPVFSDIIPNDSSKAVGMDKILSHFGLSREESIAFGDGANDIEMLEYAGLGIAMGNAAPIVKQHAGMVTDDADNEGIPNALKKLKLI